MRSSDDTTAFAIGDWRAYPESDQLVCGDETVTIEPRMMDVLACLARHAGEVVSPDTLVDEVWHGTIVSDAPLYQSLAKLRKVLRDDANEPRYIETVRKRGYRLVAPVTFVAEPPPPSAPAGAGQRRHFVFPALSLLLGCITLLVGGSDVSVSSVEPVNRLPTIESIAILPFVDMSEDQGQQYLGDGIAEELINRIAQVPDVRIVARTSSFTFRDSDADIQEIGRQLGAHYILQGSVRRSGDRLRIAAQLVNATDGYQLWAQSYEPAVHEAFAIQDQIAASVAGLLRSADEGAAPRRSWTDRPAAAEAYYLGMFHMHRRRADSLDLSIEYFREATRQDEGFALAYAGLAKALFLASDARYGNVPDDESARQAHAATATAFSLDADLPEVLEQLSIEVVNQGDFTEAEALILRAIQVNPNYAPAYKVYMHLLADLGRHDEMLPVMKKAVELDPLSPVLRINLAAVFNFLGRKADSEAQYLKAIELDPGWHASYYLYGRFLDGGQFAKCIELGQTAFTIEGSDARLAGSAAMLVAYAHLSLENFAEAEQWYQKARQLDVDPWWLANETLHWLIAQDRFEEADALLSEWEAQPSGYLNVYRFGGLYRAVMRQDDAAIALLERAAAEDGGDMSSLYENSNLDWGYMPAVHLARLYMIGGDEQRGRDLLDAARRHLAGIRPADPPDGGAHYVRASISSLLGDEQVAFEWLEAAADEGWARAWFLERDPVFDAYRDDRRFEDVLNRMRTHIAAERRKVTQLAATEQ